MIRTRRLGNGRSNRSRQVLVLGWLSLLFQGDFEVVVDCWQRHVAIVADVVPVVRGLLRYVPPGGGSLHVVRLPLRARPVLVWYHHSHWSLLLAELLLWLLLDLVGESTLELLSYVGLYCLVLGWACLDIYRCVGVGWLK